MGTAQPGREQTVESSCMSLRALARLLGSLQGGQGGRVPIVRHDNCAVL